MSELLENRECLIDRLGSVHYLRAQLAECESRNHDSGRLAADVAFAAQLTARHAATETHGSLRGDGRAVVRPVVCVVVRALVRRALVRRALVRRALVRRALVRRAVVRRAVVRRAVVRRAVARAVGFILPPERDTPRCEHARGIPRGWTCVDRRLDRN
jgi:hypothetical protein